MNEMTSKGIEYRRGSAGGGNQLRQPYLKPLFPKNYYENFKETEHIHFMGFIWEIIHPYQKMILKIFVK